MKNTIGQLVRQARMTKGWTQKELADTIGKSQNYIFRLESNKKYKLKKNELDSFSNALNISLDTLEASIAYTQELRAHGQKSRARLGEEILQLLDDGRLMTAEQVMTFESSAQEVWLFHSIALTGPGDDPLLLEFEEPYLQLTAMSMLAGRRYKYLLRNSAQSVTLFQKLVGRLKEEMGDNQPDDLKDLLQAAFLPESFFFFGYTTCCVMKMLDGASLCFTYSPFGLQPLHFEEILFFKVGDDMTKHIESEFRIAWKRAEFYAEDVIDYD